VQIRFKSNSNQLGDNPILAMFALANGITAFESAILSLNISIEMADICRETL